MNKKVYEVIKFSNDCILKEIKKIEVTEEQRAAVVGVALTLQDALSYVLSTPSNEAYLILQFIVRQFQKIIEKLEKDEKNNSEVLFLLHCYVSDMLVELNRHQVLQVKYTFAIRKAIRFAIKVHEVDQKQKRKGKDIAYITHPLTVGIILSQARAKESVVIAGILHDTVEDCAENCPVILEDIKKEFGQEVSSLVHSITEKDGGLPWAERKEITIKHVKTFSNEMVLLKSADALSNGTEIVDDYEREGESIFKRFNKIEG